MEKDKKLKVSVVAAAIFIGVAGMNPEVEASSLAENGAGSHNKEKTEELSDSDSDSDSSFWEEEEEEEEEEDKTLDIRNTETVTTTKQLELENPYKKMVRTALNSWGNVENAVQCRIFLRDVSEEDLRLSINRYFLLDTEKHRWEKLVRLAKESKNEDDLRTKLTDFFGMLEHLETVVGGFFGNRTNVKYMACEGVEITAITQEQLNDLKRYTETGYQLDKSNLYFMDRMKQFYSSNNFNNCESDGDRLILTFRRLLCTAKIVGEKVKAEDCIFNGQMVGDIIYNGLNIPPLAVDFIYYFSNWKYEKYWDEDAGVRVPLQNMVGGLYDELHWRVKYDEDLVSLPWDTLKSRIIYDFLHNTRKYYRNLPALFNFYIESGYQCGAEYVFLYVLSNFSSWMTIDGDILTNFADNLTPQTADILAPRVKAALENPNIELKIHQPVKKVVVTLNERIQEIEKDKQ